MNKKNKIIIIIVIIILVIIGIIFLKNKNEIETQSLGQSNNIEISPDIVLDSTKTITNDINIITVDDTSDQSLAPVDQELLKL